MDEHTARQVREAARQISEWASAPERVELLEELDAEALEHLETTWPYRYHTTEQDDR